MTQPKALKREGIEAQLACIIASRQFCNAPRLSRFLAYVVTETLEGRVDRLKGYTIGLEVFDKPEDFDPQTDTIVRVQARALRQKLDQYYAQDGAADPVRISISKGSYEPSFFMVPAGQGPADPAAALPGAISTKPSIAVLPFDDFSHKADHVAFSNGLTEEVIANLSRFRELSVFSRATTRKAKLDNLSIPQIWRAFRPDFVLEGSYRVNDRSVVITINLVVAASDEVILTQHFNRKMTPRAMYKLQDEMALMIAGRIADRFGPVGQYARRAAQSGLASKWATFDWISQYHRYSLQLSDADRRRIKSGLTKAVEVDPTSSDARATLALITLDQYRMEFHEPLSKDALDAALAQAQQAVACDGENATAHEALAAVRFHRCEFDLFEAAAETALSLNPGHADMLAMLGVCYAARMNWDKATPLLDQAISLNPLQPGWFHVPKAIRLAMADDPAGAVAELQISPLPDLVLYRCHLLWFLVELGDMDAAHEQKIALLELLPDFEHVIARHSSAWCIHDAIVDRAFAAFQRVGICVTGRESASADAIPEH